MFKYIGNEILVCGFNQSEKYQSNWIIFPNRDENPNIFELPPPRRNPCHKPTSSSRDGIQGFVCFESCSGYKVGRLSRESELSFSFLDFVPP